MERLVDVKAILSVDIVCAKVCGQQQDEFKALYVVVRKGVASSLDSLGQDAFAPL